LTGYSVLDEFLAQYDFDRLPRIFQQIDVFFGHHGLMKDILELFLNWHGKSFKRKFLLE